MASVDSCFCAIQGRQTLVTGQSSRLESQLATFRADVGVEGPLSGTELLTIASQKDIIGNITTSSGLFVAQEDFVRSFMENCSSAAEESLKMLEPDDRLDCFKLIASLYLHAFEKVSAIRAQRTRSTAPATSAYPPVLPSGIVKLTPREFNQVLRTQRDRILCTYSVDHIIKIEDE